MCVCVSVHVRQLTLSTPQFTRPVVEHPILTLRGCGEAARGCNRLVPIYADNEQVAGVHLNTAPKVLSAALA